MHTKNRLYYYTSDGLKINKKAMVFVNKGRKKAIKPLNKVWVEGKGLVDIVSSVDSLIVECPMQDVAVM